MLRAVTAGFFHQVVRRGRGGEWREVRSGLRAEVDRDSVLGGVGEGGGGGRCGG